MKHGLKNNFLSQLVLEQESTQPNSQGGEHVQKEKKELLPHLPIECTEKLVSDNQLIKHHDYVKPSFNKVPSMSELLASLPSYGQQRLYQAPQPARHDQQVISEPQPKHQTGSHARLTKESIRVLMNWLMTHKEKPYPTIEEKEFLANETKLTVNQVNHWFINARRRVLEKTDGNGHVLKEDVRVKRRVSALYPGMNAPEEMPCKKIQAVPLSQTQELPEIALAQNPDKSPGQERSNSVFITNSTLRSSSSTQNKLFTAAKQETFFSKKDNSAKINAQNIPTSVTVNPAATSSLYHPVSDVDKLLFHVMSSDCEAVMGMLKKDISLIFKRSSVIDFSGRSFEPISVFESALWAWDEPMWEAIIQCIPQNEEGKKVVWELLEQYNKVDTVGVSYKLNEQKTTEKHFDFENTIIMKLQTYLDSLKAPGNKDSTALHKQCIEGVGGAQTLLPMCFAIEYCSDKPFNPLQKFSSKNRASIEFYNCLNGKHEKWFAKDSKLGINFAIFKSAFGALARTSSTQEWVESDLKTMRALFEARTKGFVNLKSQLLEQIALIDSNTFGLN